MFHNSSKMSVIVSQDTKLMFVNPLNLRKIVLKKFKCNKRLNCIVDLCLFQIHFPKNGWTGVLVASRYGFADIVRELVTTYGCDRNAVKVVSGSIVMSGIYSSAPLSTDL